MNNCEYYHEYKTVKGWEDSEHPIYTKKGVCFGQKNAPECYYHGCPDECDLLRARDERKAKEKKAHQTYFDLIVNGKPEQLALFVASAIERSKTKPQIGEYDAILAALNTEVDNDED